MSAQRFGGQYSQEGATTPAGKPTAGARGPAGAGWLIAVAALPLALTAFSADGAGAFGLSLAALFVLLAAGFLVREGAKAQAAFEARTTARRPAFPRKIFGAVLTGVGLMLAILSDGGGMVSAAGIGMIGALLALVAFGPDPLRSKGIDETNAYATARAARAGPCCTNRLGDSLRESSVIAGRHEQLGPYEV